MLIGISGKIGSGKTTLGDQLCAIGGYHQKNFAGKLKEICAILSGRPIQDQYNGKEIWLPEWNMSLGVMQQLVGSDVFRNHFDPDTWVKALFVDYRPEYKWVIVDMRFPNEAQAVRNRGGLLVRIQGTRTGPGKRDPDHVSETALDSWQDWDYIFDNSLITWDELVDHAYRILSLCNDARVVRM